MNCTGFTESASAAIFLVLLYSSRSSLYDVNPICSMRGGFITGIEEILDYFFIGEWKVPHCSLAVATTTALAVTEIICNCLTKRAFTFRSHWLLMLPLLLCTAPMKAMVHEMKYPTDFISFPFRSTKEQEEFVSFLFKAPRNKNQLSSHPLARQARLCSSRVRSIILKHFMSVFGSKRKTHF